MSKTNIEANKPAESSETIETVATDETLASANQNKSGNPLSIRIDPYYKEKFEALTRELGLSKKLLIENLIRSYLQKDEQNRREGNLNLTNEINLIATNLEELLNIFSKMAVKSQDTIGSLNSDHAQQLANWETQNHTLNSRLTELTEKINLLEAANHGFDAIKARQEAALEELEQKTTAKDEEIKKLNFKNLELLEQLNCLRQVERENVLFKTEAVQAVQEIKNLREELAESRDEIKRLQKKLTILEGSQAELQTKQKEAFSELETQLRRAAELEQKTALLQLQATYNDLQAENLRCLGELNQKSAAITELQLKLREVGVAAKDLSP